MQARLTARLVLALALALAMPAVGLAQSTEWTKGADLSLTVPAELILHHEQLRTFQPTGNLVSTKRFGRLRLELREVVTATDSQELQPASVLVTYRNRLIAAAKGYRLGGDFTHNGVLIESWDGSDACQYTLWRLEFAGERLDLSETKNLAVGDC